MTLDEAIAHAEEVAVEKAEQAREAQLQEEYSTIKPCKECADEHIQLAGWLIELKRLREQTKWIPMVRREPTGEEKAEYLAQNGEELCYMLENEMPLNRQEVLVCCDGYVSIDAFDEDFYNFEGCDIENVDAWMPLPKAYKAEMESEE